MLVCYLRVGSEEAVRAYARACLEAGGLGLFRALRSGLRPHTRFTGSAADSIGRYA